ncbi:hypothetical protein SAMN02745194_00340 [Roseomonas rosea]|uniref:Uncharacterized protein n=1 Tax=Muricoccus roseus TaxID=198092 RepID=A0A1M6B2R1_9PROT|nr:hypothetical protein [Roseomonas rosea]SHI43024.1 hypothetical protein SAMN02745194_00340 [Roseomonas rosea]
MAGSPVARQAWLHLASETLALGCLFERRGAAHIRIPVHRRQQMAGCEWHSQRSGGVLRSVSYTFEALEDWNAMARESIEDVAALYRHILGRPEIRPADLTWSADIYRRGPEGHVLAFPAGSYNPLNAWNTVRGAVHLNGGMAAGFEASPLPMTDPGRLRLTDAGLERGLLFLRGRDCTAELLHPARREGWAGPISRLELRLPGGADWSLDDLTLPDGERFTPLGLFQALLGEPAWAREGRRRGLAEPTRDPMLPGPLVSRAMLRQLFASGRPALA